VSAASDPTVVTFDRDFDRFAGVATLTPPA
jgi:hypothetical protein